MQASLLLRRLPDGGFVPSPGGAFQVAATTWGILTSRACGDSDESLDRARAHLAGAQEEDGRVCVSRQHPASYWPTPLAILAWRNSSASQAAQSRALHFLLGTAGTHFAKKSDDPSAHDPNLRGWPWVEDTHSWVEPTALSVLALRVGGYGTHDRVREAIRMLLDRQLPHGGWNAGNTVIFGRELHPNPEGTGAALTGLAGVVNPERIVRSIDYLQGEIDRLRTPVSLGWALLGLAAWGQRPPNSTTLVERCLAKQSRYGDYDTSALCLLLLGGLTAELSAGHPLLVREDSLTAVGFR